MVLFRRLVLLWLLLFWLGGFTFYASTVVPIGTRVLGSFVEQGKITRRVTYWLNLAGVVALAGWAWDIAAAPALARRAQRVRWLLWLAQALALAALMGLHAWMAGLLDPTTSHVLDPDSFHVLHHVYLWVSTAQWLAAVALTAATLHAWRAADHAVAPR